MNSYTLFGIILNTTGGMLYFYTKYGDQVSKTLQEEYIDHEINLEARTANGDVNKNSKMNNGVVLNVDTSIDESGEDPR